MNAAPTSATADDALFEVRDLRVDYVTSRGFLGRPRQTIRVLDGFELGIRRGETLGVVGESGCGKTTLAHSLARFILPAGGEVLFEGRDVLSMDAAAMRAYRRHVQLVFQNPFSSLNPRLRVRSIVAEPLLTHLDLERGELDAQVEALLRETGLGPDHLDRHPHELSGGQAQRVALARAIALKPKMLLLDEPTSALDVSVQAQILNLLLELKREHDLTYMIISHSLGVIRQVSDRIAVLYLGEIVEQGTREHVFEAPTHPYTQALLASTPVPDPERRRRRVSLRGSVPSPADPPPGCRFHTRCPHAMPVCRTRKPPGTASPRTTGPPVTWRRRAERLPGEPRRNFPNQAGRRRETTTCRAYPRS